jgi:hypothetical protein
MVFASVILIFETGSRQNVWKAYRQPTAKEFREKFYFSLGLDAPRPFWLVCRSSINVNCRRLEAGPSCGGAVSAVSGSMKVTSLYGQS